MSGAVADDAVARAMADELARTSKQLVMPGMAPPHFVSYCIEDTLSAKIVATNGAIVESNQKHDRRFFVDIRVGDPDLDNSFFIGNGRDVFGRPMNLVEEDDYASIRHQLWLYTDVAHKRALGNLASKKAYLASHPVTEEIPDFAAAESATVEGEPVDLDFDLGFWQEQVDRACKALGAFSGLQEWQITVHAEASNKRYSAAELLDELRQTARDFGNEYGLLVKRLERPEISSRYSWSLEPEESTELMTDPLIMYKVYVDDGRIEPARGLTPDDITVRSLRDIIATGDTAKAFNMLLSMSGQPDACAASVVTGSILVEDAGFKADTGREPMPVSERPLVVAQ